MTVRFLKKCLSCGFLIITLVITLGVLTLYGTNSKTYLRRNDLLFDATDETAYNISLLLKQVNSWIKHSGISLMPKEAYLDNDDVENIQTEGSTAEDNPAQHMLDYGDLQNMETTTNENIDNHLHLNYNSKDLSEVVKYRDTNSTVILDLEKIEFLPNYRNPCWIEPLPEFNPYLQNRYGGKVSGYMSNLSPAWNRLYSDFMRQGREHRLRCLPYFFIGGFPKCGTTDVYEKLHQHPMITGCLFKEPHYWTRWRFWTDKCFYHEFMCKDGSRCLSDTSQCNGRTECPDGSDEWNCEPPQDCAVNNGGCSHTCNVTASGTFCTCPRGYKLKPDHNTCIGGVPLTDYIDLFDVAAEEISQFSHSTMINNTLIQYHPKVTGEATPATFWDSHRWHDEPANDGHENEPKILTAHIITHLLPKVKNIVLVRNPTERLYSDLLYFRPYATPSYFHSQVLRGIQWFNNCTQYRSLRSCVYEPMDKERPPEGRYWHPVERIRIGMYAEYIKDWLTLVPLNQIKVVRLEDYSLNRSAVLNDMVNFLDLEKMPSNYAYKWETKAYKNSGASKYAKQGPMLPETKQLLNDFYKPFNEDLAKILQDDKYLYR